MHHDLLDEVSNLSYVLFRIAESIENDYLRDRIKKRAIDLIESSALRGSEEFLNHCSVLRQLVVLSNKLNYVSEKNKDVIISKIYDFEYVLIPEERGSSFDIDSVFSSYSDSEPDVVDDDFDIDEEEEVFDDDVDKAEEDSSAKNSSAKKEDVLPDIDDSEEDFSSDKKQSKADIRREMVFEKVKKEGICFLRDLMTAFPDYSERTLRYDLENLIEEGKIEKIGNSGPGTFYRSL